MRRNCVCFNSDMWLNWSRVGVCAICAKRATSVYGGAGGSDVRISQASGGRAGFNLTDTVYINNNAKATMQNLNDRLASYLDKVSSLEKANAELELKIRQFLEKKATPEARDYTTFKITISKLQGQISDAARENAGCDLAIDAAMLTAEDFKIRYEHEMAMRQSVEANIVCMKRVLEEQTMGSSNLEKQLKELREGLIQIKRDHEEDLLAMRTQMGGQVNVEVDAVPQEDLAAIMAEIRKNYETITAKNRRDMEAWFLVKTTELNMEIAVSTETLQSSKSEITEIRHTLQTLEIEREAQLRMKANMEGTLADTRNGYSSMLASYQRQVGSLEEQLAQFKVYLERQGQEYQILLEEIAEYRRLLNGDIESNSFETTEIHKSNTFETTEILTKTTVQEVKDPSGNVIESVSQSEIISEVTMLN